MASAAGSSETLICTQCGRIFNTIEDLNDHKKSEQQDQIERNKGFMAETILVFNCQSKFIFQNNLYTYRHIHD